MRSNPDLLQSLDELGCVVALVRTQRQRTVGVGLACIADHRLGRFTLGVAVGMSHPRISDQAVPVVCQRVAHVAQFARRLALAVQPCIWIGRGGMRVVAP